MWGILWAVGKWLIATTVKVVLWAVANPLGAVLAGVTLVVAAKWLRDQPWAGAEVVAGMVHTMGTVAFVTGAGSWIAMKIFKPWKLFRWMGAAAAAWIWKTAPLW